LADEFLKRLAYVSEGLSSPRLLPGLASVEYSLSSQYERNAASIRADVVDVAEKLCANPDAGTVRVLHSQSVLPLRGSGGDPHSELLARGELISYGKGRFGLGPLLTSLVEYFDRRVQQIAVEMKAEPRTFPSLISAEVLDRCRYLKNFPASLCLVSHLREDHRVLQEFVNSVEWDGAQLQYPRSSTSAVECLLAPSVCFHWYAGLRETRLTQSSVITAIGKCFRYESSNLTGLERLWDFTMRELIFVGQAGHVLANRDLAVTLASLFLDELELAYEISTSSDPFFIDAYAVQAAYQQGFELKFELLVPLPYSGKKLAVGSINYHQEFFGRAFQIETPQGPAHTGCIGFGYERLALAFITQHGLETQHWPASVREALQRAQTRFAHA